MKSIRTNMEGMRFGRLVVVSYAGNDAGKRALWECQCDCGTSKIVLGKYMRNGRTSSCGCFHAEMLSKASVTHGMTGTATYASWASMLSRCTNPNQATFGRYGAIGVKVCSRWLKFENFLADMGPRPEGHTIDRQNPFGHYEPDNCKWSTPTEQGMNKRGRLAVMILDRLLAVGTISQSDIAVAYSETVTASSGYKSWSPASEIEDGYTRI